MDVKNLPSVPDALFFNRLLECLLRKWEEGAHMLVHSWLVSRELSEAIGPWNTTLSLDDDGEYFCRVIAQSEYVKFVSEAQVLYRTANFESVSNSWKVSAKLDLLYESLRLQIERVRMLRDNSRTRAACLRCLSKYLFDFSTERPDSVEKIRKLASEWGGELDELSSPRKYQLVHQWFGWPASKRLQTVLSMGKNWMHREWDRLLYALEGQSRG